MKSDIIIDTKDNKIYIISDIFSVLFLLFNYSNKTGTKNSKNKDIYIIKATHFI